MKILKKITYDDTRDATIRAVEKLMTEGFVKYSEFTYFEIQDIIHNEFNNLLLLDIDNKEEVTLI